MNSENQIYSALVAAPLVHMGNNLKYVMTIANVASPVLDQKNASVRRNIKTQNYENMMRRLRKKEERCLIRAQVTLLPLHTRLFATEFIAPSLTICNSSTILLAPTISGTPDPVEIFKKLLAEINKTSHMTDNGIYKSTLRSILTKDPAFEQLFIDFYKESSFRNNWSHYMADETPLGIRAHTIAIEVEQRRSKKK